MKLYNILVDGAAHVAVETPRGLVDATAAGFACDIDAVIASGSACALQCYAQDDSLPVVESPVYANIISRPSKLVCVGLNYAAHAEGCKMELPGYPVIFSKFANALVPANTPVRLPSWESTYDYEAELVIVMGKTAFHVSREEAADCIFGYTCGNDFSLRAAQKRTTQWLIGKTLPGFGPCGPCIVTADSYDPEKGMGVRSYVNGQLRQNGNTRDMIFKCTDIISYVSDYVQLEPGDLIFTGTPTGVELEKAEAHWLVPGDVVDIELEGIGTLTNTMI